MKKTPVLLLDALPFLIYLILILLNPSLKAQNTGREPNILVFSRSTSSGNRENILNSINTTASEELKTEGLKAIRIEDDLTIEELLDNAGWFGAFFIIETIHSEDEDSATLEMNCYSAWDRQLLISTFREGPLDSPVVPIVHKALEKIIPIIITNLEIIRAQPPPGWNLWEDESPPESTPEQPLQAEEIQIYKENSKREIQRLFFNASGGPLVETGDSTRYFTLGTHLSLSGGYRLQSSPAYMTAGVRLGWDHFSAEGVLTETEGHMLYTGPEIRAGLDLMDRASVFVRLSGGASWFIVDSRVKGLSYTLIPFISMGIGGDFYLSPRMGIFFAVDYTLQKEESTLFSGFYPGLGISFYL